jgi:hypothetical protein
MIITLAAWLLLTSQLAAVHTAAEVPRVIRMQTSRLEGNRLGKRDSHSVILGNAVREGLYYVNASVGTPYQKVALQIDTGSSDVWMFGPGSCDTKTSLCLGGSCKSHILLWPASGPLTFKWHAFANFRGPFPIRLRIC